MSRCPPANRHRHRRLRFAILACHLLGANAWKIVAYVGRLTLDAYAAQVRVPNDALALLNSDIAAIAPEIADSIRFSFQSWLPIRSISA
jgi:hypothetical protein